MSEEKQYPSSEQLTSEPQLYPGRESEMKRGELIEVHGGWIGW